MKNIAKYFGFVREGITPPNIDKAEVKSRLVENSQ